jgi:hypothetical protein
MGQQGLVFVFLPALLLISAVCLTRLLAPKPQWVTVTAGVIIAINMAVFLFMPEFPLGANNQRLLTRSTLENSDIYFEARFETIVQRFAPESTLLLASSSHHLAYYLPDYTIISVSETPKWETTENSLTTFLDGTTLSMEQLKLQPDTENGFTVVIFDPNIEHINGSAELVKTLSLPDGSSLPYIQLGPSAQIYFNEHEYGVLPQ